MKFKNKKKRLIEGVTVGFVAWLFLLFMIAGLRGQDVNEMLSDFIPHWEIISNIFWLILGGFGALLVVYVLILKLVNWIKSW